MVSKAGDCYSCLDETTGGGVFDGDEKTMSDDSRANLPGRVENPTNCATRIPHRE